MKIVYLIEDFAVKGGAERIIAQKANYLAAERGHEVTIVSVYADERPPAYPLCGVRLVSLDVPFAVKKGGAVMKTLSRLRVMAQAVARFNRAMDEIRPDIIFFTLSLGALILPFYRGGARKIYESHLARQFTPYSRLFSLMERKADAIICLTQGDAAQYKGARRVEVIPNFIDIPPSSVNNYVERRAVAVGRLERAKGFDIMIRCWKTITKKHPGWSLDIYGEGPLRETLQRQINSLGLENKVTLCGRTEQMMERYTKYSLHLMTSRFEGMPMTLVEAQACGLPSVTFDYDYGAREIVVPGVTGLIVPQGDEAGFISATESMMASEKTRRCYGEAARRMAARFSRNEIIKEWDRLLAET